MSWWWADDYIVASLQRIEARQAAMLRLLNQLVTQENRMAINLDAINAAVTQTQGVEDSTLTYVQQVVAYINSLPPSNDPATQAALDDLTAKLTAKANETAAAIAANPVPGAAPAASKKG